MSHRYSNLGLPSNVNLLLPCVTEPEQGTKAHGSDYLFKVTSKCEKWAEPQVFCSQSHVVSSQSFLLRMVLLPSCSDMELGTQLNNSGGYLYQSFLSLFRDKRKVLLSLT